MVVALALAAMLASAGSAFETVQAKTICGEERDTKTVCCFGYVEKHNLLVMQCGEEGTYMHFDNAKVYVTPIELRSVDKKKIKI